ncbi:MAG: MerR family transcriptional regulator [Nitrospiraceae bacterium]|jgi:predicted site-specific integrase-resolvase
MKPLSTDEVARTIGVNPATLWRWLSGGKLKPPKALRVGQKVFHFWTDRDIERVKRYKKKFYRKGRGRKKKPKR